MREASESAAKRPPRVDYDRIAHLYDEAQRDHDVDANLVAFFGDHPYALAQAPPISIARSVSLSRSVWRKGSTACS